MIPKRGILNDECCSASHQKGFSLLEMLIVLVLVSIMANLAITSATSSTYEPLTATASILTGEMAYARGLAVGNNSSYRFEIDTTNNRLVMRNTGSDPALATLPTSPFRSPSDPADQYIVGLANFPSLGMPVTLLGAQTAGGTTQSVTCVEFGPYGSTTQASQTVIWLTAGKGVARRYISVTVDPVTGMSAVGPFSGTAPNGMSVPTP